MDKLHPNLVKPLNIEYKTEFTRPICFGLENQQFRLTRWNIHLSCDVNHAIASHRYTGRHVHSHKYSPNADLWYLPNYQWNIQIAYVPRLLLVILVGGLISQLVTVKWPVTNKDIQETSNGICPMHNNQWIVPTVCTEHMILDASHVVTIILFVRFK